MIRIAHDSLSSDVCPCLPRQLRMYTDKTVLAYLDVASYISFSKLPKTTLPNEQSSIRHKYT